MTTALVMKLKKFVNVKILSASSHKLNQRENRREIASSVVLVPTV